MNTYIIYKGLKERLATVAPGFFYLGQYLKGSDKTSYIVPAIYIEMPKYVNIDFQTGKVQQAKDAQVKIHLVTNAPIGAEYQENDILEHQNKLNNIDQLLTGWMLRDDKSRLLTQQFITIGSNDLNYEGVKIFSVRTYKTEFFSYHLK